MAVLGCAVRFPPLGANNGVHPDAFRHGHDGCMARHNAIGDFDSEPEDGTDDEANAALEVRFETWATEKSLEMDHETPESLLHYKWAYLDGHFTRLSCATRAVPGQGRVRDGIADNNPMLVEMLALIG